MNPEAGHLGGEKSPQLTRWATLAGDWMIPFSLATVMAGQIFFSAFKFYLGIEHPAWPFWGMLAAGVMLSILRVLPTFKVTRADMAMLAFVAVLTVSFLVFGSASPLRAIYFIAAFMLLPYLAGRLLDEQGIGRFILALSCITFLALPLIGFGLLSMPESELQKDRISALFTVLDPSSYAGISTIPHASIALGLLLVQLTSSLAISVFGRNGRQYALVALMCCVVWVLIFVGLRGAILAALLVGSTSLALGHGPNLRRIALLSILILAVVASWMTMPSERITHFGRASSIEQLAGSTQEDAGWEGSDSSEGGTSLSRKQANSSCVVYGDSIATRLHLYNSAVTLFLESPWLGAGASNYGIKGYCGFDEAFMSPHSILLQVLAELGLAGAIVFLSLVWLTVYGSMQIVFRDTGQRQGLAWMLAAVWCFFFLQDQLSGNYFTSYHFFAVTGLISGLSATSVTRSQ